MREINFYKPTLGGSSMDALAGLIPLPQPVPEGTLYTCPRHAEVRHVGPGICPECGRALEPVIDGADVLGPG